MLKYPGGTIKKLAVTNVLTAAVLTGCAGPPPADTPVATATATTTVNSAAAPTKTPTPAPVKTSGDYGADLAAAGTVPDDVEDYGTYMAGLLCNPPITRDDEFGNFSHEVYRNGEPGDEAAGRGPAVVQLTVAYYCPERIAEANQELKKHGYLK